MDSNNKLSLNQDLDSGSPVDSQDFFIKDAGIGGELLGQIKELKTGPQDEVIYGVSDAGRQGFFVRINEFLINHSKVTLKEKSYFFHMLAVMVDAGVPLVQSVKSLAKRTQNIRFRRVLNTVAHNSETGAKMADAMSRFPDIFSDAEIGIVRAGEEIGKVDSALFKLSDQLDKQNDLNAKVFSASVYPIVVLIALVVVTIGMLVGVLPRLLGLLTANGMKPENLPWATRMLIDFQSAFTNYWWLGLIVLFGLYGLFVMYVGSDYGATKWDYLKLRTPIIGKLLRKLYVLRFVSMTGLLIDAGLPVIVCLKVAGGSLSNRIYRLKVQEIIEVVKNGGKISEAMGDSEFLFPHDVVEMTRVGESTAHLGQVSEKISAQYQKEVDDSLTRMMALLGPLMVLVVGVFVALLAVAIMAPIFNLGNYVGVN